MGPLTFPFDEDSSKPVFYQKVGNEVISILVDTGASLPLWTDGLDRFLTIFPEAEYLGPGETFGVGGRAEGVWYKTVFAMGDITYTSLPILCLKKSIDEFAFSMLLSYTMLYGLDYLVRSKRHQLVIYPEIASDLVRNLTIVDKDGSKIVVAAD